MRLDDSYRLLDLDARASDEDVKRAWRDLTKVWHPDRFANDPSVQRKAEAKLKAINEAYEAIRGHRGHWRPESEREREPGREPADMPETAAALKQRRVRTYRSWSMGLAMTAFFILLRRPTPGGLLIAAILFCITAVLLVRMGRVRG